MTSPHTAPALETDTPEQALDALREHGLRVSAARRLVVEALFAADRPLSAEDVAEGLGGRIRRSDLASVYRNLETLQQVGLVRHFHLGHGAGMYALAGTADREYLVCESCGDLRAVPAAALDRVRRTIKQDLGWDARFDHFPIAGRCAACSKTPADPDRSRT